jgi:hypothetical protein
VRLLPVPFVAILFLAVGAFADSIEVDVRADRSAVVREHFSQTGSAGFVFLASACARIENPRTGAGAVEVKGSGPWMEVAIPASGAVDLSYEAVPAEGSPRSCAVPVVMPKRAIESVSVTVVDQGSGLKGIAIPRLAEGPVSRTWSATFPAVPSRVQLEWPSGDAAREETRGPVGLFFWNFGGLAGVLVTWTIAYLIWAKRQAA